MKRIHFIYEQYKQNKKIKQNIFELGKDTENYEEIDIMIKENFTDKQYKELIAIQDRINEELKEIEKKFPNRKGVKNVSKEK